jgi:hypothetical protein
MLTVQVPDVVVMHEFQSPCELEADNNQEYALLKRSEEACMQHLAETCPTHTAHCGDKCQAKVAKALVSASQSRSPYLAEAAHM